MWDQYFFFFFVPFFLLSSRHICTSKVLGKQKKLTKSLEVTVHNTSFCWILTTESILVLAACSRGSDVGM